MEADRELRMFQAVYKKYSNKVYMEEFVSEDDLSIRKMLRCKTDNGTGDLPEDMKEPIFLADVNHHIKCMAGPFFT